MNYPTLDEVEKADRVQLARWFRFLKSPGESAIDKPDFESVMHGEKAVQDRIIERFQEMGGMTPAISKQIGW